MTPEEIKKEIARYEEVLAQFKMDLADIVKVKDRLELRIQMIEQILQDLRNKLDNPGQEQPFLPGMESMP